MKHKYVRHSILGVALWPADTELYHKDIAWMMKRKEQQGVIVSAGFVEFQNGKPRCFGRSESLSLGGQPDDAQVLALQLGLI